MTPTSTRMRRMGLIRLDAFQASHRAELGCHGGADFRAGDPNEQAAGRRRGQVIGAILSALHDVMLRPEGARMRTTGFG